MSKLHPISGCQNPARRADVLFIHGLGGDPFATWRHGEDEATSWPHWLGQDFPDVGVWSLGYAASPSKWPRFLRWFGRGSRDSGHAMSLPDRATEVLDLMVRAGLGQRPLFCIGHSLGGLLAKQVLRRASDDVHDPRKKDWATYLRAVLFLGTPHGGADLASLLDAFSAVFRTTVLVEDLRAHDAHLRELYNWYRNHSLRRIQTFTYYEDRDLAGFRIVNPTSAHPGVGHDPVPQEEDHISLAKPRARDAQVYQAACDILRNHVLGAVPAWSPAPLEGDDASHRPDPSAPPVPREMPRAAARFFGRKDALERLVKRLREGLNTTVVGPAGYGKTALAAMALETVLGPGMARLASSGFPDGVVGLDLYAMQGATDAACHELATKLRGSSFLDRLPGFQRATEACRGRRVLVVVEGAEEADGQAGRATIADLRRVESAETRWLILTRDKTQAEWSERIELGDVLERADAEGLLASILDAPGAHPVASPLRDELLGLLQGHPLAITWAGNLLARGDDDAAAFVREWRGQGVLNLMHPTESRRTLAWLFERSVRRVDAEARRALAAAGRLALEPFPWEAIASVLGMPDERHTRTVLRQWVQRGLLRSVQGGDWQFDHALGHGFAAAMAGDDADLGGKLAGWLVDALARETTTGWGDSTPLRIGRMLRHADALLRADQGGRLHDSLVSTLLRVDDRLDELGQLPLRSMAVNSVKAWFDRLPSELMSQPAWQRDLTVSLDRVGDVLVSQGDGEGALACYRESLGVMRRLAQSDATNAGWQRDLTVSLDRVGDVLVS
ncbi:MAG: hypothetical protein WCR07_12800, partial [Verrucomicrobiota bacterium]